VVRKFFRPRKLLKIDSNFLRQGGEQLQILKRRKTWWRREVRERGGGKVDFRPLF
jgi:hypothetical protein